MENIDIAHKLLSLVVAAIGLIAATIGLPHIVEKLTNLRRSRLREEFKFIKEFITDLKATDPAHPFVIEKGYLAISGNDSLTAKEITYLLSLKTPSVALKKYARARKYLELHEDAACSGVRINFKQEYSESRRTRLKWFYGTGYFLSVFIAFAPILFAKELFGQHWKIGLMIGSYCLIGFGAMAYSFIADYGRVLRGEELIKSQ